MNKYIHILYTSTIMWSHGCPSPHPPTCPAVRRQEEREDDAHGTTRSPRGLAPDCRVVVGEDGDGRTRMGSLDPFLCRLTGAKRRLGEWDCPFFCYYYWDPEKLCGGFKKMEVPPVIIHFRLGFASTKTIQLLGYPHDSGNSRVQKYEEHQFLSRSEDLFPEFRQFQCFFHAALVLWLGTQVSREFLANVPKCSRVSNIAIG